jgi:hypothetical protein
MVAMHTSQTADVYRLLRDAGWFPGRHVPELVACWRSELEADGFVLHRAAEAVLSEYGGLQIGSSRAGVECARSDVRVDPSLCIGERDRFHEYFAELQGRELFPLGEVAGGNAFLGITPTGEVYELMDAVFARWPSFETALRSLLIGIRPADT